MMISIQKTAFFCGSSPVIMLLMNLLSSLAVLMRSPEMLVCVPFVQVPAFKIPNADERETCSTHHAEYCDNFLQKFQPLMQFGPQISFCHFSQSLAHV